jgi:hypothetical protein
MLRVGAFVSRKHGEGEKKAVAGANRQLGRSGGCSLIAGGVGITNARATRAEADTCSRKAWVAAAVAVSGAEEGSADDVVGLAGAPGSSTLPKACLGEWAVVLDSRGSARDRWLHPG